MDSESFECAHCANCCKTYWITLLPSEAKKAAKALKLPLKTFLSKYCILFLQAFPSKADFSNPLIVSSRKIPERILARLSEKTIASFFLMLPGIAFKRKGKNCVMLSKTGLCKIHALRPGQCRLFPLINLGKKQDLKKAYSFCKGLKGFETVDFKENQKHFNKVKDYFESVKRKGFKKEWLQWPVKGILLLDNEKVCGVSGKEFFKISVF